MNTRLILRRRLAGFAMVCWIAYGSSVSGVQVPLENTQDLLPDVSRAQLEALASAPEFDPRSPLVQTIARRMARVHASSLYALESTPFPWNDPHTALPYHLYDVAGDVRDTEEITDTPALDGEGEGEGEGAADASRSYWLAELDVSGFRCRLVGLDGFTTALAASAGNRRCSARAIFLAHVRVGGEELPLFATRRLAWHPDVATDTLSPGAVALGAAGIDVGLVREAPLRNGRNLDHEDTLAILQILSRLDAALAQTTPPYPPLDVVALLQAPREFSGDVVSVYGTLDRVTTVDLRGNRVARQFGLTHYYQLDMHVPLGDRQLNVQSGRTQPTLSFEDAYPITVLIKELPAEIQPGPRQSLLVELPAFVYRMWSFASVKSRRLDPALRQVVPILIGDQLRIVSPSSKSFSWLTTGLVVGGMVSLLALAWLLSRPGKRSGRGHLAGNADDQAPDFSQLDVTALPTGGTERKKGN